MPRLLTREEQVSHSRRPRTAGAADPVEMRRSRGEVKADDARDAGHVETPGRDVGGDEERGRPRAECSDGGLALLLHVVASEYAHRQPLCLAVRTDGVCVALRLGEDDRAPAVVGAAWYTCGVAACST